jgi:predicted RNA-binding Zn-ribbon protein involved in translation (DUF1610 family)
MKVTQVQCPQCGQAIYQKQKDEMFLCQTCGTIHYRDQHGVHRVAYEIAASTSNSAGPRYYMPFWRLHCDFNIRSRNVEGGYLHKLSNMFGGADNGGSLFIFVAEKPGTLQYLDYDLKVREAKLVYLPFVHGPNGLQLMV